MAPRLRLGQTAVSNKHMCASLVRRGEYPLYGFVWLLSFIRLYWSSNGIVIPEVKLLELPVSVWLGPIMKCCVRLG